MLDQRPSWDVTYPVVQILWGLDRVIKLAGMVRKRAFLYILRVVLHFRLGVSVPILAFPLHLHCEVTHTQASSNLSCLAGP